jgi:hypothetical protein
VVPGLGNIAGAAIGGGIGLLGGLFKKKGTSPQDQMQSVFDNYQKQASPLITSMSDMARGQHTMASPALESALKYYTNLAGGNRGAIMSAIAPQIQDIQRSYLGSERGLMSRLAPGPVRDVQLGELYRQRAGDIGRLPFEARNVGAQGAGQLGSQVSGQAGQLYGQALSGLGYGLQGQQAMLSQIAQQNAQREQNNAKLGGDLWGIFGPWLTGKMGGGKA